MRSQYALPARVAKRVNDEAREMADASEMHELIDTIINDNKSNNSANNIRSAPHVAAAVRQMLAASPHDDALTGVGVRNPLEASSRSSMSLALIEDFDLDALLADESSLLQAQLEEEEEYFEDDAYPPDPALANNNNSFPPPPAEPPHKQPPPPPADDDRAIYVEDLPDDDDEDALPIHVAVASDDDELPLSTTALPLPPTPLPPTPAEHHASPVVVADAPPAEPPEEQQPPPPAPTPTVVSAAPLPPQSPRSLAQLPPLPLATSSVLPPPPVPPEADSIRAPPEPESTRPTLSGSFGLNDLDQQVAQRTARAPAAAAASKPPVPSSAPPSKPTATTTAPAAPAAAAAVAPERSRSPGRSKTNNPAKKTKSPSRRGKKERPMCDNCKERKASHRATLVTGQVIKLCAVCTDRARDAKRAAEQKQAALAASSAAPPPTPQAPSPALGSASPNARKRERGMRYLEKVFPSVDRTTLSKALEQHRLDFLAAGEALQREQQASSPPSVPPAPKLFSPAPDVTTPVPPPVPPWDAPPAPTAPPTRLLPNRERRATLREQFLLNDVGAAPHGDRGGEVSRVAELRLRLADEQRVRADQRQLRDAIIAKLERVRAQRARYRDRLDSVSRQVRFMQDDELPQRDIERVKDQKRQLVRKLLELDEKNNKYVGMLRRVDADRARNDAVRTALQDEIAQLTVELERRAADAERAQSAAVPAAASTMGAMSSGRRESLRMAVEQLRTLSTLKVDKDGLVVVPTAAAAAAGMPLPPPRRGPLPPLPANPAHTASAAATAASVTLPRVNSAGGAAPPRAAPADALARGASTGGGSARTAVDSPPPAQLLPSVSMPAMPPPGRPPLANRLPLRVGGSAVVRGAPTRMGGPGSAHLAVNADEQQRRDSQSRPRSNSDADSVAPPVVVVAPRGAHPLAVSVQPTLPPRSLSPSPPPPLPVAPIERIASPPPTMALPQQPQVALPSATRRLAFPTMPALASPFRVHTRPVPVAAGSPPPASSSPPVVPPFAPAAAAVAASPPPASQFGSLGRDGKMASPTPDARFGSLGRADGGASVSPPLSPSTMRRKNAMTRPVATKRLEEIDDEMARLRKDGDAMAALVDFYAKDPNGRAKVERERAKVARQLAALRDERATVLAALGPEVEQHDLNVARQQLQEVEAAIAVRTKAHSGLSVLVQMYANDASRAQGRQNAEDELADITVELDRLEQRRDALQKLVDDIDRSQKARASGAPAAAAAKPAAETPWRLCVTEQGDEYFYNPKSDETSWELPDGVERSQLRAWEPDERPAADDDDDNNATDATLTAQLDAVESAHRNSGEVLRSVGDWTAFWSKSEKAPYYYNERTEVTTWDCPPELVEK